MSPELAEVFALEAEDHLRTISSLLPILERQPDNKEFLQQVRRSAHSLKGSAAMVGFQTITQLAHRMEDLLGLLYDGDLNFTPEILSLLFASTDALEDMTANKADEQIVQVLYEKYTELLGSHAPAGAAREIGSLGEEKIFDLRELILDSAKSDGAEKAEQAPAAVIGKQGQVVRVPIERLDELVKLVSELVITRTSFEQSMAEFASQIEELQSSSDRLRRVSSRLETQYEASTLGGKRPSPGPASVVTSSMLTVTSLATHNTYGFDDLEFDRYTEFHLLSRELTETTNDIYTVANGLGNLIGDFDSYLNRQSRLYSETQVKLMRVRMVPLAMLASRLQRTVRNVATKQGKLVELIIEGEETELDKTVLEELADPLLHLLRNAVDHGIEPPALRQVKGKSSKGQIRLRASYEGTQIVIRISDDGAGLEPEVLRAAAITNGYVSSADAPQMTDQELFSMVFLPGFSTTQQVSEVSGRGAGLDIVKATVHKLKGTVTLDSKPGQGATFTVRLPMTLAITRALLVKAHNETFALPLGAVTQILRMERDEIEQVGQEPVVRVGGEVYPLLFLGKVLGLKQPPDEDVRRPPVLIVNVDGKEVALVIDQLLGGREIVIKNLGSHLRQVHGVTGATLMGDGSVVLILNLADLVGETIRPVAQPKAIQSSPSVRARETLSVMVVDDSPSVRRVISNLIKTAGWRAVQAKDGLEALEILHHSAMPPDLILLDIEMPRMDGYELLSTLRAQDAYQSLPIVILTSRAGEKHRQKAFDLGATEYIVKPYRDEFLLSLVQRLAQK